MKDGDEFNYEVYFGSASIFTLTFGLGILSEFIGGKCFYERYLMNSSILFIVFKKYLSVTFFI